MGALILSLIAASLLMGWCIGFAMGDWLHMPRRTTRQLPAATPRAIARVRRRNRADIRAALARHGVTLREPVPPIVRPLPRFGFTPIVEVGDERPFVPLPADDFETDDRETR